MMMMIVIVVVIVVIVMIVMIVVMMVRRINDNADCQLMEKVDKIGAHLQVLHKHTAVMMKMMS